MSEKDTLKKLNIGCGTSELPGFINLDHTNAPHIDILHDLESGHPMHWKDIKQPRDEHYRGIGLNTIVPENYFDRMLCSHVFEHIKNPIAMMRELWRVAKPGCSLVIITPYGSSDNAWEDPTHVRPIFKDTYIYYNPLAYNRADYGVDFDWSFRRRQFSLDSTFFDDNVSDEQIGLAVATMRNVVKEFLVEMVAVKPARQRTPDVVPDAPITSFKLV